MDARGVLSDRNAVEGQKRERNRMISHPERFFDFIPGNSPAVVRKHCGKWSKGRQDGIDQLMMDHFRTVPATVPVTRESHKNCEAVN